MKAFGVILATCVTTVGLSVLSAPEASAWPWTEVVPCWAEPAYIHASDGQARAGFQGVLDFKVKVWCKERGVSVTFKGTLFESLPGPGSRVVSRNQGETRTVGTTMKTATVFMVPGRAWPIKAACNSKASYQGHFTASASGGTSVSKTTTKRLGSDYGMCPSAKSYD